jgi:hypothetical protein
MAMNMTCILIVTVAFWHLRIPQNKIPAPIALLFLADSASPALRGEVDTGDLHFQHLLLTEFSNTATCYVLLIGGAFYPSETIIHHQSGSARRWDSRRCNQADCAESGKRWLRQSLQLLLLRSVDTQGLDHQYLLQVAE